MPKETSPGFQRHVISIPVGASGVGGTGALELFTSLSLGFRFVVESLRWITTETLTGSGGTQTYVLRKGNATGTVLASVVTSLASHATIGSTVAASVSASDEQVARVGRDADTISLTRTTGGTAFTAGGGVLLITLRQRDQARR